MAKRKAAMERGELTPRQRECYDGIVAYLRRHKKPPTFRDICKMMGVTFNAATGHVRALRGKGWLEEIEAPEDVGVLARSIIPVTEDGSCPYCGKLTGGVQALARLDQTRSLIERCLGGDGDRTLLREALENLRSVTAEVEEAV